MAQVARRYAINANLTFKWRKETRYVPNDVGADIPVFLLVEISHEYPLAAPPKDAGPVQRAPGIPVGSRSSCRAVSVSRLRASRKSCENDKPSEANKKCSDES